MYFGYRVKTALITRSLDFTPHICNKYILELRLYKIYTAWLDNTALIYRFLSWSLGSKNGAHVFLMIP